MLSQTHGCSTRQRNSNGNATVSSHKVQVHENWNARFGIRLEMVVIGECHSYLSDFHLSVT
jgi:hypothetical protein